MAREDLSVAELLKTPRLRQALHRALDAFLDELATAKAAPATAPEEVIVPNDLEQRAARNAQIELRRMMGKRGQG